MNPRAIATKHPPREYPLIAWPTEPQIPAIRSRMSKSSNVMLISFESLVPPETVSPETAWQASCLRKHTLASDPLNRSCEFLLFSCCCPPRASASHVFFASIFSLYLGISSLNTCPPFITNRTRSSSVISLSGSPATATMSANLPGSNAPISFGLSKSSAATNVAD